MDGPNFNPRVGEEVRVDEYPGLFKIAHVNSPTGTSPGLLPVPPALPGSVNLESIGTGQMQQRQLVCIPWTSLRYVDEARVVRRVIEWLKTSPDGRKYPDYIVDYEVTAEDDHAGNPSIYVRFLVDSDYFFENGKASEEKVATLNAFLYDVRQTLLGLGLDRWTYVRAGQARKVLDVAS
jgi:hypothetical protein